MNYKEVRELIQKSINCVGTSGTIDHPADFSKIYTQETTLPYKDGVTYIYKYKINRDYPNTIISITNKNMLIRKDKLEKLKMLNESCLYK